MDSLRNIIRQTLSEAFKRKHYTRWKTIEEDEEIFASVERDIATKIADKLNLNRLSFLDSGTSGFAYHIPNNRVLKITKDKSEVVNSKKIQGKSMKHLANIYETYSLQGKYNGTYVVISEFLSYDEKIEDGEYKFARFCKSELQATAHQVFTYYYKGQSGDDYIDLLIEKIKRTHEQEDSELIVWYLKQMCGIIKDLKNNDIITQDWGAQNLGLKRNGNIAMFDLGYGENKKVHTNQLQINEEAENMTRMDYPDFLDTQYNPNMENSPYPPMTNPNRAPMREVQLSPEEVNKKNLPLQYHNLWSEFLQANQAALGDILPTLRRQYSNLETLQTVKDVEKDNPALYDEFAEWIYNALKTPRQ